MFPWSSQSLSTSPSELPHPGEGKGAWVGAGSPPFPHTRCWAEPGIPAHCWASPFANPLPNHKPAAQSLSPARREAGVGGTWPGWRELGCRGLILMVSRLCHVLLPTFALSGPSSLRLASPLLSFTSPSHILFRVQCSMWLSSHQATARKHR